MTGINTTKSNFLLGLTRACPRYRGGAYPRAQIRFGRVPKPRCPQGLHEIINNRLGTASTRAYSVGLELHSLASRDTDSLHR